MKNYILFLASIIFNSCIGQQIQSLDTKEIVLKNISNDSIIVFTNENKDSIQMFREIEIIENSISDTLMLGYAMIPPKFVGKIWFIQESLDPSIAVYLDPSTELNPNDRNSFSKLFSIGLKNQTNCKCTGLLKFNVKLKK